MGTCKALAIIFLAVFLILTGLISVLGVSVPALGAFLINSLAVASGVLLLISLRHCCETHKR